MNNNRIKLLGLAMAAFLMLSCDTTQRGEGTGELHSGATGYDSALARKYGADEYGMKKYIFAFLKKGPNRNLDPSEAEKLQKAHLDNIARMAESGELVLAGPFIESGEIRGIYIFDVESMEEAERLTSSDPAVRAGSLAMELHQWYGSAALGAVNKIHRKISRRGITE
ncbi:MAG: hypothetical protein GF417_12705 [Candidatus Latescibacteria bacterium]|nr:hypothetical protein [bacterium]MBD3425289.1 hypothetical protein [Candidatus Latescibacterota bacterium]